jgi:hypothetical protein
MTLSFAKSNQPIMLVSIPLIILACWLNPLPQSNIFFDQQTLMPLYSILLNLFPDPGFFNNALGYLLFTAIVLLLTRLNTKFMFIPERTYLPSVIYGIIVLSTIHINKLHPLLIAIVLLLLAFERMLSSYKNESLTYNSFDAALLIGIASLFYFQSIILLLFLWIILSNLRPFYWREWIFTIIGLALPYFFFFGYAYLTDYNLESYYINIEACFIFKNLEIISTADYIFLGFLLILVILSSQYIIKTMGSMKILARKSFNLFLALFLLSLAMYFSIKSISGEIMLLIGIPLSMIIANYFIASRTSRWKGIIFDIMVGLFILLQFLRLP